MSELAFLLHFNTYVINLRPLEMCDSFSAGTDFISQNVTSIDGPRSERVNDVCVVKITWLCTFLKMCWFISLKLKLFGEYYLSNEPVIQLKTTKVYRKYSE